MKVMLKVAYDGTNYHGWQYQTGQSTIEGMIRIALKELTGEEVELTGASRTDAGVHALGNIAVFENKTTIPGERLYLALNTKLPDDIRIIESIVTTDDFHPRFDAKEKTYEYHICNEIVMNPVNRLYAYHYPRALDIGAMNVAGGYIEGEHDFTSLSSVHAQVKNFVRTVYECCVTKKENGIVIKVRGNGFLYNMVRIIAGTLLDVGVGKITPEEIEKIILKKDRTLAGATLPACGLILKEIKYL